MESSQGISITYWSPKWARVGNRVELSDWTLHDCWCQMGWSEYCTNCWSTEIHLNFMHNPFSDLGIIVWKRSIEWLLCVCKYLVDIRNKRKMGSLVWVDRRITPQHIQGIQIKVLNTHFCLLKAGKWACNLDRFIHHSFQKCSLFW